MIFTMKNIDAGQIIKSKVDIEEDGYLNLIKMAEWFGVSSSTIQRWKRRGVIPKPFKVSGTYLLWSKRSVIEHLDKKIKESNN